LFTVARELPSLQTDAQVIGAVAAAHLAIRDIVVCAAGGLAWV
jgi:TPP-dependent trihydroxycyclohexane-1,2-dione (THcHDO) dehydratase